MSRQSALLIGATGATGRHVLRELLKDPQFTRIGEFGRRSLPESELHGVDTSKLQRKVVDFEKLDEKEWKEGRWDIVYISLGTTRKQAGSAEAFEKIDRDYVINAAKAAKSADSSHQQRLVYLSSGAANASSPFPYLKSKGLTERGLASLGYSDFIAVQAGVLVGAERSETRIPEAVVGWVTGALSYVGLALDINVATLGRSIATAGKLGTAGLPKSVGATQAPAHEGASAYTLISNTGAIALSKEN
ncbi:NAD(P)H-binding family protein [Rhizoctonia solani 123E]|uniref:NAD(P)H-binding family protein n=1 Tax=Rhizoctonia solani 123E TaxID=1423351 RepID=A0A074RX09_9AGAM|nr:NAD(P)H-binding family protein [Rhizoctonia solani 123E]